MNQQDTIIVVVNKIAINMRILLLHWNMSSYERSTDRLLPRKQDTHSFCLRIFKIQILFFGLLLELVYKLSFLNNQFSHIEAFPPAYPVCSD